MTQDDIRKVLMLQAVEENDEAEETLTPDEKGEAASIAGAPLGKDSNRTEQDKFLAGRADVLLDRAASRFPEAANWLHRSTIGHRYGMLALGLGIVAAVIGFLTNELGPEKRINILSFPLLAILLWSLFVYLRDIFSFFRSNSLSAGIKVTWIDLLANALQPGLKSESIPEPDLALTAARNSFQYRWRKLYTPVITARLKSLLHTVALILAASAILGMYVKGLANEYTAVWESTFFQSSEQLRPFLQTILGPAAAITGEAIPSAAELEAIHWSEGAKAGGENAARWIHWYAITIGLFVLLPRAIFATIWKLRADRMARTLPFRKTWPRYFDRIISISSGAALDIALVPYALDPDETKKRAITKRLEDEFKRPLDLAWGKMVPFGEEEHASVPEHAGEVIPVYDFASTPEIETHLALYTTLRFPTELGDGPSPVGHRPVRSVILDTSAYDKKADSFSDADERKKGRLEAWKKLFASEDVRLLLTSEIQTEP